jgi:hypothetical protein
VGEGVVAQADGGALVIKDLNVMGRSSPCDHQADGVRPSVYGCQLYGCGHSQRQSCESACEGL